jgi:hypothetical protein
MSHTHPSQIITGEDLSIRWSATGSISSFTNLGIISNYALSLQWQTKETIPVGSKFEETAKMALKGTLNLTALTDKTFEMPDPFVWIEIGLLIVELANGDRWQWNRTAKYLITNDTQTAKPDDMVQHQYTLLSQNAIVLERVLIPTTVQVYWKESFTADLQVSTNFGSITFTKIL